MNIIRSAFLILITVLLLLSNILCIQASSNSGLSVNEARDLVYNALNLFNHVQLANPTLFVGTTTIRENNNWYILINEQKLPGGSYEEMQKYAEQIYTDDLAPKMYRNPWIDEDVPAFIWDDSGNIYVCPLLRGGYLIDFGYSLMDWKSYNLLKAEDLTVKLADVNEESAIVWIKVFTMDYQPHWLECPLIKTESGWRISESAFTDFLRTADIDKSQLIPYEHSPSTGDTAGERVAVISAVSLACIIPTACLMRRRRRASAE